MKRSLLALAIASAAILSACGAEEKTIEGITYATYGLVNQKDNRNPNIAYEVSGWSVFWSIVFCETVVVPVYFFGWDLYEPVGKRDPNAVPGQVN